MSPDLSVQIGSLHLSNPILVASGTFGYAREMENMVDLKRLGGIIPKTVTVAARSGNIPPRTVETSSGLLNSIGLDNDGIVEFLEQKLPYFRNLNVPLVLSIAAKKPEECHFFAEQIAKYEGIDAIELNVSCPNVSGGVDYGSNPKLCREMVLALRVETDLTLIVKLSPNVTNIAEIAQAAQEGGADCIAAINTVLGLAVDWRNRRPRLGNGFGGLSGPAIKPIALRAVRQIYKAVSIPIIGIGGINSAEDVLEFVVAGASAIQVGTANFFNPNVTTQILDDLPLLLEEAGITSLAELRGNLDFP
ncbi:MAG: dihydroorotate dehydrogenase [Thermoguttaceae bacterium]